MQFIFGQSDVGHTPSATYTESAQPIPRAPKTISNTKTSWNQPSHIHTSSTSSPLSAPITLRPSYKNTQIDPSLSQYAMVFTTASGPMQIQTTPSYNHVASCNTGMAPQTLTRNQ